MARMEWGAIIAIIWLSVITHNQEKKITEMDQNSWYQLNKIQRVESEMATQKQEFRRLQDYCR